MTPRRRDQSRVPLRTSADKAFDAVDDIVHTVGVDGRFSDAELAEMLDYAGTSNGAFQARLNALRRLGLVVGPSTAMALTPLARRLASADRASVAAARLSAVLTDPFLAAVVDRYAGRRLPGSDELAVELQRDLDVPASRSRAVVLQTVDSLRAAGLLQPDRTVVPPEAMKVQPADDDSAGQARLREAVNSEISRLPSPSRGWTLDDLDRWLYVLRARLIDVYRLPVRLPTPGDGEPEG